MGFKISISGLPFQIKYFMTQTSWKSLENLCNNKQDMLFQMHFFCRQKFNLERKVPFPFFGARMSVYSRKRS